MIGSDIILDDLINNVQEYDDMGDLNKQTQREIISFNFQEKEDSFDIKESKINDLNNINAETQDSLHSAGTIEIELLNPNESISKDKESPIIYLGKKRNKDIIETNEFKKFKMFKSGGVFPNIREIIGNILQQEEENSSSNNKKERKKNIIQRKFNSDNIRKKFVMKLFKDLTNSANKKLKNDGVKKIFKLLPENLIKNLTKKKNQNIFKFLDLSFKDIFSETFLEKKKKTIPGLSKFNKNISTINYLEKKFKNNENSNYNNFKNKKMHEIIKEYLESEEFETAIDGLKKENDDYINRFVVTAYNLIDFLSTNKN